MPTWNLQAHRDVEQHLEKWQFLKSKVNWTLVQLALNGGMTVRVKGWSGSRVAWRRTPVRGNHYYLWWVPQGAPGAEDLKFDENARNVFVRDVRHHNDDTAPDLGHGEYHPVSLAQIDPRYEDQHAVTDTLLTGVKARMVSGSPGSGKTVALQFATIESTRHFDQLTDQPDILYVTYTDTLAEQAKALFASYEIADRVKVCTLRQLEDEILCRRNVRPVDKHMADAYSEFESFLARQPDTIVGPWRRYPRALWSELRAYLAGMALPFPWNVEGIGPIDTCRILDKELYKKIRRQALRDVGMNLDDELLEKAHNLGTRVIEEGILAEQDSAYTALQKLHQYPGELSWLGHLHAVIVDEIQDLTALQIGLLAEVGRQAASKGKEEIRSLLFVAAGDESQIVQPSGFDWGIAHNLLRERLGTDPDPLELLTQRRCPRRLAQLIEDSWNLYKQLPRGLRPRGKAEGTLQEGETEDGILLRWDTTSELDWAAVFGEFRSYPNLAIVDLNGGMLEIANQLPDDLPDKAKSTIYSPRQIKGLERDVIVVNGLCESIKHVSRCSQEHDSMGDLLALLQARRIVDDIRVALSRSTHMLIIVEQNGTQLTGSLSIGDVDIVDWDDLCRYLHREHQDITAFDKVHSYLRVAEESFQQQEFTRADQQIKQAQDLLPQIDDQVLARQVQELQAKNEARLAEEGLKERLQRAYELWDNEKFSVAFDEWEQARSLLVQAANATLETDVQAFWEEKSESDLNEAVASIWKEAQQAKDNGEWSTAALEFGKLAHIQNIRGKPQSSETWRCLADRYGQLPHNVSRESDEQVTQLVKFISQYIEILERAGTGESEVARSFAEEWLSEAYQALADRVNLYLPWAKAAQQAFVWKDADFSEEYPEFIADAWMAAEELRKTGESEQALELLVVAQNDNIPEDLAIFVGIIRSLVGFDWQELGMNLYPAEIKRLTYLLETRTAVLKKETEGTSD